MRFYWPIAKIDQETRMVYGYATTEAEDDQGETIKREAVAGALDDYMRFANIREMHQPSAVGIAKEANLDDTGLYLGAKIVDEAAWQKVVEGVYKGFSIGGRVTARDPKDRKIITGISLSEISVVDRPANPEAVFDCWKRGGEMSADVVIPGGELGPVQRFFARLGLAKATEEPYGDVDYADPGYQDDKKKRYPLDTEKHIRAAWNYIHKPKNAGKYTEDQLKRIKAKIVAAWKAKIDADGPPEATDATKALKTALAKHLLDAGPVADMIWQLDWLADQLEIEAAIEGDDSPVPAQARAIIAQLSALLRALVEEGTAEMMEGEEAGQLAAAKSAAPDGGGHMQKRSEGDQHLMDLAHAAFHKGAEMDGVPDGPRGHMVQGREAMKAAGAGEDGSADEHSTVDTGNNPAHPAPTTGASDPTGKAAIIAASLDIMLAKRGGYADLMDIAHHSIAKLTDGATCKADAAKAARHSKETLDNLHRAHFHAVAAGAKCDAAALPDDTKGGLPDEHQGTKESAAKSEDLAKAVGAELATALAPLLGRLEKLGADVDQIKKQPLPPATVAIPAGLVAVTKGQDGGGAPVELSEAELVAKLARMSDDERQMLLIKAALSKPILPPGLAQSGQLRAAAASE